MKRQIADAFAYVPEYKRGALIVMGNEQGASLHVAARLNGVWKVAAGAGVPIEKGRFQKDRISAWVVVEAVW